MKAICLLLVAALLAGCVSDPEKPPREMAVIAPRESSYRDTGYDRVEAKAAAARAEWNDYKTVRPPKVVADYASGRVIIEEPDAAGLRERAVPPKP